MKSGKNIFHSILKSLHTSSVIQ